MTCPECGASNPDNAEMCRQCGHALDRVFRTELELEERLMGKARRRESGPGSVRVIVIALGICSCALTLVLGAGNFIGLGAGVAGCILDARRDRAEPGRALCIIGIILNGVMAALLVVGAVTLTNCVGIGPIQAE